MEVGSSQALGSRYELIERIGSGAMGEVWRTLDRTTGRHVAAKLLRSELTSDPEIVGRFIQERSILVGLDHPGLVSVLDLVVEGDRLAIVMELITGGDLRGHLRERGTLAAHEAVGVAIAVLEALDAAHRARCLHRDVKPDNVLVVAGEGPLAGRVRLTDFGIARLAQESTVQATGLLGTPGYMPPELFSQGSFSGASDVYAVGIMLYELLAGRTPFAGTGTAHTVGFRHVTSAPPELPLPAPLWNVLSSMLAKEPSNRLGAAATAAALRELDAAVLAAPALPVQPEPTTWRTVDAGAGSGATGGPIKVRVVDPSVDVGATNLHARETPAVPLAEQGEAVALAPAAPVDGEQTLHRPLEVGAKPVLEPAVVSAPERKRPWWPWVAGAAAAVAIAVVIVPQIVGGGDDPTDGAAGSGSAAGPVAATLEPALAWSSGLTTTLEATYDMSSKRIALTVTSTAPNDHGARGPILIALPEEGDCDGLAPADGATEVSRARLGRGAPCGFQQPSSTVLAPGASATVTASVAHDLGPDADAREAGLKDWLSAVGTATRSALGARNDDAFVAQRLAGACVDLEGGNDLTFRGSVIAAPVVVWPIWLDDSGTAPGPECDRSREALWRSSGFDGGEMVASAFGEQKPSDLLKFYSSASCPIGQWDGRANFSLERQGGCRSKGTFGPFPVELDVTVSREGS